MSRMFTGGRLRVILANRSCIWQATLAGSVGREQSSRCDYSFFQAEDGIRDYKVTGVQTCALPIWPFCPVDFFELSPTHHQCGRFHQSGRGAGGGRKERWVVGGSVHKKKNKNK